MKRKSFTITEVLIGVVILAILSSTGIVIWSDLVDKTEQKICAQNQIILKEALKFYISDNEAVPVSLSQLMPKYWDFSIARLKRDKPCTYAMRRIYFAILNISEADTAWALPSFNNYVGMHTAVVRCPAKVGLGVSYGFNSRLRNPRGGRTVSQEFNRLESIGQALICDCEDATFGTDVAGNIIGAEYRHGKKTLVGKILRKEEVAIAVGGKGIMVAVTETNSWTDPEKVIGGGDEYNEKKDTIKDGEPVDTEPIIPEPPEQEEEDIEEEEGDVDDTVAQYYKEWQGLEQKAGSLKSYRDHLKGKGDPSWKGVHDEWLKTKQKAHDAKKKWQNAKLGKYK